MDSISQNTSWNFSSQDNLHPVFFTGLKMPHEKSTHLYRSLSDPRPLTCHPSDLEDGPNEELAYVARYLETKTRAPAPCNPKTIKTAANELPSDWSKSVPVEKEEFQNIVRYVCVFVPDAMLTDSDTFELSRETREKLPFATALDFLFKALSSKHEGSRPDAAGSAPNGRWFTPEGSEIPQPKFEVFAELVVERYRSLLLDHKLRAFPDSQPADIPDEKIILDSDFKRRVLARKNRIGVRFWFCYLDPKFNVGRALQHQVWRNALGSGQVTPEQLVERFHAACANGKKSNAANDGENGEDDELARVLGDEVLAPEPDGESTGDPDAQGSKKKQKNPKDEAKRRCLNILNSIGIPIRANRDPEVHRKLMVTLLPKTKAFQAAARGTSRFGSNFDPSAGVEPRDAIAYFTSLDKTARFSTLQQWLVHSLEPERRYRAHITTLKALAELVYAPLLLTESRTMLGNPRQSAVALNERGDVGRYDHSLHPEKLFSFERTCTSWLEADSQAASMLKAADLRFAEAAPEFLDEANYVDSATGALQFPVPLLVWRFPMGEFSLRELRQRTAFWQFSPIDEKLLQVERQAVQFQREREQTADKLRRLPLSSIRKLMKSETGVEAAAAKLIFESRPEDMKDDGISAYKCLQQHADRCEAQANKALPGEGLPGGSATPGALDTAIRHLLEHGDATSGDQARRQLRENVIDDIMSMISRSTVEMQKRIDACTSAVPEQRDSLMRLFRKSRMDLFTRVMRPDTKGVNGVHSLHNNYFLQHHSREAHFPMIGYDNLTFYGSLKATFIAEAKHHLKLAHSEHIFDFLFNCMVPNCYSGFRAAPLHVLTIGPPGVGKSLLDFLLKWCKVEGTVVEANHQSNLAFTAECNNNDQIHLHDEAGAAVIGDSTRAGNPRDFQAVTMMKQVLSNDYISIHVLERTTDGSRLSVRKRMATRVCIKLNSNVFPSSRDTANSDRLITLLVTPFVSPEVSQQILLEEEFSKQLREWSQEHVARLQTLDTLMFRTCKMIECGAAAQPNVSDVIVSMAKGMKKLARYGITSDSSMRRIQQAIAIATSAVISTATMATFAGATSATLQTKKNARNEIVSTSIRAWDDNFMKHVRFRLFCTEDIKFYVLSQMYRQLIKDWPTWISLNYLARAMGGFTETYFGDLFAYPRGDAWECVSTPDDKHKRYKQRFPFTCRNRLLKNRTEDQLDKFVTDFDLLLRRFEIIGLRKRQESKVRRTPGAKPINLEYADIDHLLPMFFYRRLGKETESPDNTTVRQGSYVMEKNKSATGPQTSRPPVPKGFVHNPAPPSSSALPESPEKGSDLPQAMEIDINWIVLPFDLAQASAMEASGLCSSATRQGLVTQQSLMNLSRTKSIRVPVFAKMQSFMEKPRFEYDDDGKGGKRIRTQTVKLLEERECNFTLYDGWLGTSYPPQGRKVFISTAALLTFNPAHGLFEFLSATEYEHTPRLEAPIDLPVFGQEGYQYTHKSFPREGKRLRRHVAHSLTSSIVRSLYMEHTAVPLDHLWKGRSKPAVLSKDDPRDAAVIDELNKKEEEILNESVDKVVGTDAIKNLHATSETRTAHTILPNLGSLYLPQQSATTNMLGRFAYETMQSEFYNEYHITAEWKRWMQEQYGKVDTAETPLSERLEYPGNADKAYKHCIVQTHPLYSQTRRYWRAVKHSRGELRVKYPEEIIHDLNKQQPVNARKATGSADLTRDQAECDAVLLRHKYHLQQARSRLPSEVKALFSSVPELRPDASAGLQKAVGDSQAAVPLPQESKLQLINFDSESSMPPHSTYFLYPPEDSNMSSSSAAAPVNFNKRAVTPDDSSGIDSISDGYNFKKKPRLSSETKST